MEKRERIEQIIMRFGIIVLSILMAFSLLRYLNIEFSNRNEVTIELNENTIEKLDSMLEEYNKENVLNSNRNDALVYIIEKYILEHETFGE